jgi:sortase (surface protein transpeptidase)
MITCYPFYYVGSAPKRFIVEAELVGQPGAAPSPAKRLS